MLLKDVRSKERLLDDVLLFLHRPIEALPELKRMMLQELHQADTVLAGKKVLIVDDDIRNIFAMTSILEPHKMQLLSAETGKSAHRGASGHAGHRRGADGHHDARHGWITTRCAPSASLQASAACRLLR
jgi:ABC-type taurine transport system ATPase subunit